MATIIDAGYYTPHSDAATIVPHPIWYWTKYCEAWMYRGVPAPMTIYAVDRGCTCTVPEDRQPGQSFDYTGCPFHTKEQDDEILYWLADDPSDKPVA